ncbi:MAG: hypothetical protein ACK40S_07350 [Burkholderiaceae bacterium]
MSAHINELREHLMQTLASLRDRENPMEPDRARAVAQVAGVLVDTARVEVDYLKATGKEDSTFLRGQQVEQIQQIQVADGVSAHNPFPAGIVGITRHRLA